VTTRPLSPRLVQAEAPSSGSRAAVGGRLAPQLVTFLAIDLAESSTVLASLGEDRVEGSRVAYLTLLRNAIAAHRGREILRNGDRMLIAFDIPSDAVGCAVAVHRASERQNRRWSGRLDVRIGIHVGEAIESAAVSDRGDFVAHPAIQARQLCDAALGGQILVSDLVSALARREASYTFERAGLVELEGFADPVPTFEIIHERVASERPPLPPGLAARPAGRCSFVGRTAERERLRGVWPAAAGGERRMAFLMGEPGIGKSRFAAEFAAEVHADGAVVLSGRSFEESIVPYQPFVEGLRQYVADCEPIDLEAQLGGDPSPITWLGPIR
jgi:class 3 adenylate cyclase